MSNSLVSVIIPAYNAQNFIAATIQSVIDQTYPYWEMLIVDDGSTDGTRAVVQSYLADSRIKYLYQENQERAAARNHGIRHSSGTYIAFLDADDLWLPDKLRIQVEYLDNHPEIGLCFTHYRLIDGKGLLSGLPAISFDPHADKFYRLLKGDLFVSSSVLVSRFVFDNVGLFDETLPVFGCEDWDMWLRIARYYPIHFINHPLVLYRLYDSNTSLEKIRRSGEAVLQKIFSDPTLPIHIVEEKNEIYAIFYFGCSETCLRSNQRKLAFRYWQWALKIYPKALLTTRRGLLVTLKLLFLPYILTSNLSKLRLLIKGKR